MGQREEKNGLYWAYNLPLQVWPRHENPEEDASPIIGARLLNYMPRKECVTETDLDELIGEQSREEFFESAAKRFENMARLFRKAANDPAMTIYYHDEGMEDAPQNTVEGVSLQPTTAQGVSTVEGNMQP